MDKATAFTVRVLATFAKILHQIIIRIYYTFLNLTIYRSGKMAGQNSERKPSNKR